MFDGATADGASNAFLAESFRHILLTLSTDDNADLVIKFAGSNAEDRPNFASAQSPTNEWDYVQVKDLEDNASIAGDTGITLSGTDDLRQLEVNTNGMRWICAIISSYSAGTVYLKGKGFNE